MTGHYSETGRGGHPTEAEALARRTYWILRDQLAVQRGTLSALTGWISIGPMTGPDTEALRFASKEEALRHPAFTFRWTFFEPEEVRDA